MKASWSWNLYRGSPRRDNSGPQGERLLPHPRERCGRRAEKTSNFNQTLYRWWGRKDSNLRSHEAADLQSVLRCEVVRTGKRISLRFWPRTRMVADYWELRGSGMPFQRFPCASQFGGAACEIHGSQRQVIQAASR